MHFPEARRTFKGSQASSKGNSEDIRYKGEKLLFRRGLKKTKPNPTATYMANSRLETFFPLNINLDPPKADQVWFPQLEIFINLC